MTHALLATEKSGITHRVAMVLLLSAVLAPAFYMIEHRNAEISGLDAFRMTGDEMSARAADGDPARRLAIPALGLVGILLLMRREGRRLEFGTPLGWLLGGYVAWCAISLLWSVDLRLTLRHVIVLLFCSLGALGIARQFTLRELWQVTLVVSTILILNSVWTEISLGTFRPLAGDYRFAGNLHPNVQAPYCAAMALAAACLAMHAKGARPLLWGLCLLAIVLLVLTKSRTACAAVLVALFIYGCLGISWEKRILAGVTILGSICTVAFISLLLGWDIEGQAVNVALIGRQEESESLSGRVPFWLELVPHATDNILFGHGYRTFWDPQRIGRFSQSFQWTVTDGHSAYLDTLLDLGVVGVALLFLAIATGIVMTARRYLTLGEVASGLFFALLTCRALNGVLESGFVTPTNFVTFIIICGLLHLAFYGESTAESPSQHPAFEPAASPFVAPYYIRKGVR